MNTILSDIENNLGREIYDISFKVHLYLGLGLLESVYEKCFCHELALRNIPFKKQVSVPIIYEGMNVEDALRIDILVDETIIVELKAQENYHPVWEVQLLSYLKLIG
jgi:GxxExxY protein